MREATRALHEAAHAVVALELGYEVIYVTIEPERAGEGTRWGATGISRRPDRHYSLADELALAFAGPATTGTEGSEGDGIAAAVHYAIRNVRLAHLGEVERRSRYQAAWTRVRGMLAELEGVVDALAAELLRRGRMDGGEVRRFVRDAKQRARRRSA